MKVIKVNHTDKQPVPKFLFSGKELPSSSEWAEISKRFESHFDFIRVFGFNPDIIFSYYDWHSELRKNDTQQLILHQCGSDNLSLVMVLAILQKLNDLPDFVSIVEE